MKLTSKDPWPILKGVNYLSELLYKRKIIVTVVGFKMYFVVGTQALMWYWKKNVGLETKDIHQGLLLPSK